ncbi:hypothetical protein F3I62_02495 [Pseudomonas sp. R-28-1W-6]|jgi:hypothetical protein|uniref:hypothetical protein n=1 Tax=Pseudomonas sp. R-28-1W-6 TaxID=2650101 RepID=UPI001365BE36|nr:hypothetical protein [Pseudomonas sp. R-28-1W-6]MWV10953.1 hypothetical protein [Pseudomonas sp. R-28-1W-6]
MPRTPPTILVANSDQQLACRLRRLLHGEGLDCTVLARPEDCSQAPLCGWLQDQPLPAHATLHASLADAIEVLERSRHAFKSRDLADLRQRLEQLLGELSAPPE